MEPQIVQFNVPVTPASNNAAAALFPGVRFDAVLQGKPGDMFLAFKGLKIPLGDLASLNPGQSVAVEVVATQPKLQLRLAPPGGSPSPNPPSPTTTPAAPALPATSPSSAPPPAGASPASIPAGTTTGMAAPMPAANTPAAVFTPSSSQLPSASNPLPAPPTLQQTPATATVPGASIPQGEAAQQSLPATTAPLATAPPPSSNSGATVMAAATDTKPSMAAVIREVMTAMGRAAEFPQATWTLPAMMPAKPELVRPLLALHLTNTSMGADLVFLANTVREAANSGLISPQIANAFSSLVLTDEDSMLPERLGNTLSQLVQTGRVEGRLAEALRTGASMEQLVQTLKEGLRAEVAALRGNEAMLAWVRGKGQLRRFEDAASRVINRLDTGESQNLHGLRQPYQFLELPVAPQSGFEHAMIHVTSEGGRGGKGEPGAPISLVMDVAMTKLGNLWISVGAAGKHCRCLFRVDNEYARGELAAAGPELEGRLQALGFDRVSVRSEGWDGDRLRDTAALLRRFHDFRMEG